jgi:enoyl-CoA hydratase
MQDNLVLTDNKQGVNVITINNPPANALSEKVIADLDRSLGQAVADRDTRCILFTGQGDRVFASGADLRELEGFDEKKAVAALTRVKAFCGNILDCPKPTIAAINGVAFGGGLELAMCCDFRVGAAKAKFGLPEINLAVMPGSGGTQLLPLLIGMPRARWMMLSGEAIKAGRALEIGLIDRLAEEGNLMDAAMAMGKILAAKGPLAYASIKSALKAGQEKSFSEAMREETRLFGKLCNSRDKAEGVRAFIEKREPKFTGR